ncbi:unnamed protein product [Sympodiomycopsis kandeliae]
MLLTKAIALLPFLAVAGLALPARNEHGQERGEHVISRNPESERKLEAMRRWNAQIHATSQDVASKYPVDHIKNIDDYSLFDQFLDSGELPEPVRGKTGSKIYGPTDDELDRQNPDTFVPPNTDSGTVPQSKWPFSLSHNRLQNGGWARQQNKDVLPVATELAGVQMHLDQNATRELHWHNAGEWAYVLNGTFRVGLVDEQGRNYLNDVSQGDLWMFPSGLPHSIQAISEGGGEFLLVFTDGAFSEDETFLLSDFTAHIPREVLVKNFPGFNNSDFDNFPDDELYIFPAEPASKGISEDQPMGPNGKTPDPYTYNLSSRPAQELAGGSVKIVDSSNFTVSEIAAAEVTINPGAMRELHWHPSSDEWTYFISGHARITIFAGTNNARTYDFQGGDVAYIPKNQGHMVEALGNKPVKLLETFKSKKFSQLSLSNWLSLTPPNIVKSHTGWSDKAIAKLQQFKHQDYAVVQGSNDGSGKPIQQKRSLSLYGGKDVMR